MDEVVLSAGTIGSAQLLLLSGIGPAAHLDPNYLADDRDMETILSALRVARRIGESPAFRPWGAAEVIPGPDSRDDAAMRIYLRRTTGTESERRF